MDLNFDFFLSQPTKPFTVLFQENEIEFQENDIEFQENEIRNNKIYLFTLINPNLGNL